MKIKHYISLLIILFATSCVIDHHTTKYYDDIYYNPNKDLNKTAIKNFNYYSNYYDTTDNNSDVNIFINDNYIDFEYYIYRFNRPYMYRPFSYNYWFWNDYFWDYPNYYSWYYIPYHNSNIKYYPRYKTQYHNNHPKRPNSTSLNNRNVYSKRPAYNVLNRNHQIVNDKKQYKPTYNQNSGRQSLKNKFNMNEYSRPSNSYNKIRNTERTTINNNHSYNKSYTTVHLNL